MTGTLSCDYYETVITYTNSWGNEIGWTLTDSTGEVACSGGPYDNYSTNYEYNCCMSYAESYSFT